MNFLAHLYLSFSDENIMIGNFIADHVKGNQILEFSSEIQQGIQLHRAIDTYTDNHSVVKKSKERLHSRYRHYDGVIIDIFYDYFLAKNWNDYSAIPLQTYANEIYSLFTKNYSILPIKTQQFVQYMISYNILYNYQFKEGIQKVLNGMNHRTQGKSQMHLALEDLIAFEEDLDNDFTLFFKELVEFSKNKLASLRTN